jgi:hypothetical protein
MEYLGIHQRDEFLLPDERVFFEACLLFDSLRLTFMAPDFPPDFADKSHLVLLTLFSRFLVTVAGKRNLSLEPILLNFSIFTSCCLRDFDTPRIFAVCAADAKGVSIKIALLI